MAPTMSAWARFYYNEDRNNGNKNEKKEKVNYSEEYDLPKEWNRDYTARGTSAL